MTKKQIGIICGQAVSGLLHAHNPLTTANMFEDDQDEGIRVMAERLDVDLDELRAYIILRAEAFAFLRAATSMEDVDETVRVVLAETRARRAEIIAIASDARQVARRK